ncbi:MAG: pyridoxal phosphate-dependent aminotransferase [Promethearchaeia archaeon]
MQFSNRLERIKPFMVMEVLEKAKKMEREGIDVNHLEIGEPDFDTPQKIINGCMDEISRGETHYTHSLGILELREAIANKKHKLRGVQFDPEAQIMITSGTSPAFSNIMSVLIDSPDEVIITDPGYPCYVNFVNFFNGKVVSLPIYERDEFNLDIERLKEKITPKSKALILNSPSNPTGQIIPRKTLSAIADLVQEHHFWVISDEIYSELTYSGSIAPSLSDKDFYGKVKDKLIILDGFSKIYAMTGWRLGYIISPAKFNAAMTPIQQNFSICAPSISQVAGFYALECEDEKQEMIQTYKKRRDYLVDEVNNIKGLSCLTPPGAFYIFANIKATCKDSMTFSTELLEKAHVATCPGIAFGPHGDNYVRLSYATELNQIKKAMERIRTFLEQEI